MSAIPVDRSEYIPVPAPVRFKNIATLTDFSSGSSSALNVAVRMAKFNNSKVSLIHAIEPSYLAAVEDGENGLERLLRSAEETMREQEQKLQDIRHELIVERGTAYELLQRLSRLQHLDLVVVGTAGSGRSSNNGALGSTAKEILARASCPVLSVGDKVAEHESFPELTHVLVPIDVVSERPVAISYAESLAAKHQARLLLLQVVPANAPPCSQEAAWMKDSYRSRMGDVSFSHPELKYPPQCLVEFAENPAEGVLRVAEKLPASIIVLEKSAWQRDSSTSRGTPPWLSILLQATCPVLTVS
jgi:nucleotide-binding universal stress UspA family protein